MYKNKEKQNFGGVDSESESGVVSLGSVAGTGVTTSSAVCSDTELQNEQSNSKCNMRIKTVVSRKTEVLK
jgi:hypothetical protein